MSAAPAIPGRKWALTGLPLLVAGGGCLWVGSLYPPGFQFLVFLFVGLGLIAGSLLALSRRMWCRRLAIAAWLPFFFVVPFGTLAGFFAIPALWRDLDEIVPAKIPRSRNLRAEAGMMTPEEIRVAVGESARWGLGIHAHEWDREIVRDLRITPANLNGFLDDLEESYGLPFGAADRREVKTLTDVADMLSRALAA